MRGENIICIAEVGWDRVWQRQNEVMFKLSANNRVLVVENLELRVRKAYLTRRKLVRILAKTLQTAKRILTSLRRVSPGLIVFSPIFLPFGHRGLFTRLNVKILVRSLRRLVRQLEFGEPIFWIYLPSALVVELVSAIPHKMVIYDCSSNFPANPLASESFAEPEQEVMEQARVVFVASRNRYKEIGEGDPKFVFIPNGVDFPSFEDVRKDQTEEPGDISSVPHPIIGYIGTLHYWVDYDLLQHLAESHPDWSLVLVGPVDALVDLSRLLEKPNVYLLGRKTHAEIPHYVKSFDVGIIPYRITPFTKYVYPTKLHEYFALGKPVVTTKLPELEPYRSSVRIGRNRQQFAAHIENVLEFSEGNQERARIEIARENSWDSIVENMAAEVRRCL